MAGAGGGRCFLHRHCLCDVLPPDSIDQPRFGQHGYLSCARFCAALWANFSARSHHPCHAGLRGNYRAGHCTINAGSSEQITAAPISHPRGHICPPCMAYRIATEKSATAPAAGHAFARLCQRQQAPYHKEPTPCQYLLSMAFFHAVRWHATALRLWPAPFLCHLRPSLRSPRRPQIRPSLTPRPWSRTARPPPMATHWPCPG